MEIRAKAKFVRISPRKARLVVDQVRGLTVVEAEKVLRFMNKKAAESVLKVVQSAAANAEHNNKLSKENLIVAKITATDGFTMKRWTPRAFGRATTIRKRTSHIEVILDEKEGTGTKAPKKAKKEKKVEDKEAGKKEVIEGEKPSKDEKSKQTVKGVVKKIEDKKDKEAPVKEEAVVKAEESKQEKDIKSDNS